MKLADLLAKYPFHPTKTKENIDRYLLILRDDPKNQKVIEALSYCYLGYALKFFWRYQENELDFLGYLFTAVYKALEKYKYNKSTCLWSSMLRWHLLEQLCFYRIMEHGVVTIAPKTWRKKEYDLGNVELLDIYVDESTNMERDYEYKEMISLFAKYENSNLSKKSKEALHIYKLSIDIDNKEYNAQQIRRSRHRVKSDFGEWVKNPK